MGAIFFPKRLTETKEQVNIQHPLEREVPIICKNDELYRLINEIVSLELFQVKTYSLTLSEDDVFKVIGYIPHNYYGVKLDNLFLVFKYRSTKRICDFLYKEWQSCYDNRTCNKFMESLLVDNEDWILLTRKINFGERVFKEILSSDNIPIKMGIECLKYKASNTVSLEEKAKHFYIDNNTVLFHDIERLFYTFCTREDYLVADLFRLEKTISKFNDQTLIIFLNNFLSKLTLNELDRFISIGKYLDNRLGDVESTKCRNFFINSPIQIWEKYHNWIIRIKINDVFGNDERSVFWRGYKFVSRPQRFYQSNSVSMEFENYIVVEFLGQAMGPMYFYKKDVFNSVIYKFMKRQNNQELRQTLYHNPKLYVYREIHSGYWQGKIHRLLIRERITEKLDLNR